GPRHRPTTRLRAGAPGYAAVLSGSFAEGAVVDFVLEGAGSVEVRFADDTHEWLHDVGLDVRLLAGREQAPVEQRRELDVHTLLFDPVPADDARLGVAYDRALPLFEIPAIHVLPGVRADDPRLDGIVLRPALNVVRVTVLLPDGQPASGILVVSVIGEHSLGR